MKKKLKKVRSRTQRKSKRKFRQTREQIHYFKNTKYHTSTHDGFIQGSENFPGFQDPIEMNKKAMYSYR